MKSIAKTDVNANESIIVVSSIVCVRFIVIGTTLKHLNLSNYECHNIKATKLSFIWINVVPI